MEAGHHRHAIVDEFSFFLKRVNPRGGVQRAHACDAGDQSQGAQASDYQTQHTAPQPAGREEAGRQKHYRVGAKAKMGNFK